MSPNYSRQTTGPAFDDAPGDELLVADSFLVEEGAVRFLARHRERFLRSVAVSAREEPADTVAAATRFWDEMPMKLPRRGAWFPRVEYREGGFGVTLRPAPALEESLNLAITGMDPRVRPQIKGPSLASLVQLRQDLGAEPLLLTKDGHISEGATTALVWADPEGTLYFSADEHRVPSVTEAGLRDVLDRLNIPFRDVWEGPRQLKGRWVWALNALHGVRTVSSLNVEGASIPLGDPGAAPVDLRGLWSTQVQPAPLEKSGILEV